jgi:hypothetical protein
MTRTTKLLGLVVALSVLASAVAVSTAVARHDKGQRATARHQAKFKGTRATAVHCGMVVTTSIVMANDLTCPVPAHPGMPPAGTPPFGLLVPPGTEHITINLAGHTLTGPRFPGKSADATLGHSVEMNGIQLSGASHVTVENGTIQHFDAGVVDGGGNHNHLERLIVKDNHNYETVNGAVDYLPPSPNLVSVTPTGTVTTATTYTYSIATAQVPDPTTTLGDNGTDGHSYTQDSLVGSSITVTNNSTLAPGSNYNTVTFTGVAPAYATGYRILRSVNGGAPVLIGTVAVNPTSNTYTFVDSGQTTSTTPYYPVSLENNNVSVDDTCNNGDGIEIDASNYDTVDHNVASGNGPFSGISMIGEYNGKSYDGAMHNHVFANKLSHNAVLNLDPGYNNPHNAGMSAYCGTGPGGGGMTRGREVQDSGIRLEGPNAQHNLVEHNVVGGSGFNGIAIHSYVCSSSGPQPNAVPNSYNTITRNIVFDTGKYTPAGLETMFDGIGWLASGPSNIVCVSPDNTVTDNRSYDNLRDGIYMGGRANGGNYVAGNVVRDNASNGIEVAKGGPGWGNPPNTFTHNVGSGNAGYDGFDGNPGCAGDMWSADVFGKVNQACVK